MYDQGRYTHTHISAWRTLVSSAVLRDAPSCSPASNGVHDVVRAMLTCEKVPKGFSWQVHGAARFLAFSLMPRCRSSSSGSSCPVDHLHIPCLWSFTICINVGLCASSTHRQHCLEHWITVRLVARIWEGVENAPPTPRKHLFITDPPYAKQCMLSTCDGAMAMINFEGLHRIEQW